MTARLVGAATGRVVRIDGDLKPYLSVARSFDEQAVIEGTAIVVSLPQAERDTPEVVRALVNAGARIVEVCSEMPDLEDVYLRLVRDDGGPPKAPR